MPKVKSVKAQAMPTAVTLPATVAVVAKPVTVALRGGPAITSIKLSGTVYRTGAVHNKAWFELVQAALKDGAAPVAPLVGSGTDGKTVPSHFIGYCIRRGYLTAV